jgi:hypothetical protein
MVVGDKHFGVVSSPEKCLYFSTPIGLQFVRFLNQIFGYTALHYAVYS